ncbi:hypothetical protein A4G19_03625 [Pasteurellaceae bacterium Macca]|nr:hypothetical protein [Pasteurellaceae bacterium Macca]
MSNMNKAEVFDAFKHWSSAAARAEQKGDYKQAIESWSAAEKFAETEANQLWCQNRGKFCQRVYKKPFGGARR